MEPQVPDASTELNLIKCAKLTEFKPEVIVQASHSTNCNQHIETNIIQFIREEDDNPEESIELTISENHEDEDMVEHVVDEDDLQCSNKAEGSGTSLKFFKS